MTNANYINRQVGLFNSEELNILDMKGQYVTKEAKRTFGGFTYKQQEKNVCHLAITPKPNEYE